MTELERVRWGHFIVRVRQGPAVKRWEIEDLGSGEISRFKSPHELLAFIRSHLVEKEDDMPTAGEAEAS